MLNRRALLSSAAAGVVGATLPWSALAAPDPQLTRLFDTLFQEQLRNDPEEATQLGLDTGINADLKSKLSDQSASGIAAAKARNAGQLAQLKAFDATSLSKADRVNYDTVLYTRESNARIMAFDFGGASYGPSPYVSPYVVSQQTGAYQSIPDFLDTKHRIESAADADAYLARLEAFAAVLDDNTERMRHDEELGVIPPDFVLDLTLAQLNAMLTPVDRSLLVTSIARRTKEKGLGTSYATKAAALYVEKIMPALARQIDQAKAERARATHDAGVWQFRNGEAFYAAALQAATTTRRSADEVHRFGLDQATEIAAKLDVLLKAQGLTKGTVGQRIAALSADPRYLFPNTDAGKADAIAYCNGRLAAVRSHLPAVFNRLPNYGFEVRRVPLATEAGAPSAFSQAPSLDGSRPGIVYFNLHDSADWPKFALPTAIFHEGLPGHQLEVGLALTNVSLPLIRKTLGFSGYAEGWALYAEQLADEIGMYEDDVMGRIGYLKFQLFRAGRCVVDTGIHHMRWSRQKAIRYFVDLDGDPQDFATREVERYSARPGQACSYKIGHSVWTEGRARAQAALGSRYNIKDFHDAGLNCGRVPLDVLDSVIGAYIREAKA